MGFMDYQTQIKNRFAISVKDNPYNAKGDGVTDDSAAINAALATLSAPDGFGAPGCVIFPAGKYLIESPLLLEFNNISAYKKIIRGYGATIVSGFDGPTGPMMTIQANELTRYLTISGLGFEGSGGSGTETEALFLVGDPLTDAKALYQVLIQDVSIENIDGICLHTDGNVFEITIDACNFASLSTTVDGVFIEAGNTSSMNISNSIWRGGRRGLRVESPLSDIHLYGNTFLVAWEEGCLLEFVTGACIINNHIEANWLSAPTVADGGAGLRAVGGGSMIGNSGSTNASAGYNQQYVLESYAAAGKTWFVVGGEFQGDLLKYINITADASSNPGYTMLQNVSDYDFTFGIIISENSRGRLKPSIINWGANFVNVGATVNPNLNVGSWFDFGSLTQDMTINAPIGITPVSGDQIIFTFLQDAVGNWKITWDPVYKVNSWQPHQTPFEKSSITFIYNDLGWQPLSAVPALTQLMGAASWTPGVVADGASAATTVTIAGVDNDTRWVCLASWVGVQNQNLLLSACPQAPDTVRVVLLNATGAPVNLATPQSLRVIAFRAVAT